MKKQNGLLPGWPPFHEFKKEIADLISRHTNEVNKPIKDTLETVKDSLLDYMSKTDDNFQEVKLALTNHVTDTNKKIDEVKLALTNEVNAKLDKLLKKS